MTEGKCTFGTRMPLDLHMLNEVINRETRHFRTYKNYRPNFGSIPVAGKFYASHDALEALSKEDEARIYSYQEKVGLARVQGPHSKYPEPVTENQEYGWIFKPLLPMDRNDRRFQVPRKESVHTKIELAIRHAKSQQKQK